VDSRAWAERLERDLVLLCHAGLDSRRFRLAAQRRLRQLIPAAAYFWATTDPATILATNAVSEEVPEAAHPLLWANEFLDDDVNKFVHLARAERPVGHLYGVTARRAMQSVRHREIFMPIGFGDELRAALVVGGHCWGVLCLNRAMDDASFTPADVARLVRLVPHLAEGLRTGLLLDQLDRASPRAGQVEPVPVEAGPGLIMLAEDLSVMATTPVADRWLAEMQDWPRRSDLPNAVIVVATRLRSLEREGIAQPLAMPRARVRTRSGRWLMLHASRLSGQGAHGPIAVIVEVARPAEVAPLILQAYGLTEREAQITQLVLQGYATKEIGAALAVAEQTVQQHLKAIFDKTGVRSRRELVARIFAQQYAPQLAAGAAQDRAG
jgi:DNA-binding CsgD family transcriptional regulator